MHQELNMCLRVLPVSRVERVSAFVDVPQLGAERVFVVCVGTYLGLSMYLRIDS